MNLDVYLRGTDGPVLAGRGVALGTTPIGNLLTKAPPEGWESYTTHTLSGGANNLDVNTDYKVVIPNGHLTVTDQVIVNGGRNVVVCQPNGSGGYKLGGHITMNNPGTDPGTDKPALGFRAHWNGDPSVDGRIIHVEGILFDGDWLNDMVGEGDPAAIIHYQNCHGVRTYGSQALRHADVFQPYFGFKESWLDSITATTGYQGLMIKRDIPSGTDQGPIYLRRINIYGAAEAAYLWWTNDTNAANGVMVDNGTVWFDHSARSFAGDMIFWPEAEAGGGTIGSDGTGTYFAPVHARSWDGTGQGYVYEGSPVDYCPASVPGENYTSPGYLGEVVSVTAAAPAMIDPSSLSFPDEPMVISSGGTYSNLSISAEDGEKCVVVETGDLVVFENCDFRHTNGTAVELMDGSQQVEFYNCRFFGEYPSVAGTQVGDAVEIEGGLRLVVENCLFQRSRLYIATPQSNATIRLRYNVGINMDSRVVDANGDPTNVQGYYTQWFQMNGGDVGIAIDGDVEVAWNEIWAIPGEAWVEDTMNFYGVGGVSGNPILVHHNLIHGAYPIPLDAVDAYFGGGILLQDSSQGGGNAQGYIEAYSNVVLNSANYGIAIAAGHHHTIRDNRIFRVGTAAGVDLDTQDWGYYVDNLYSDANFSNHSLVDNIVSWQTAGGSFVQIRDSDPGANYTKSGNTLLTDPVTFDTLDDEVVSFREAAQVAGVTIGPGGA